MLKSILGVMFALILIANVSATIEILGDNTRAGVINLENPSSVVNSIVSADNCIFVNPSSGYVTITFNTSCGNSTGGGGNFSGEDFAGAFDTNLSSKTTDDLTEGITNKYDNQSWNESKADLSFLRNDGDSATGNYSFNNDNEPGHSVTLFAEKSSIEAIDGNIFTSTIRTGFNETIIRVHEAIYGRQNGIDKWRIGTNKGSPFWDLELEPLDGGVVNITSSLTYIKARNPFATRLFIGRWSFLDDGENMTIGRTPTPGITRFTDIIQAPNICYSNGSNCISGGDNSSWNQSFANTLYVKQVDINDTEAFKLNSGFKTRLPANPGNVAFGYVDSSAANFPGIRFARTGTLVGYIGFGQVFGAFNTDSFIFHTLGSKSGVFQAVSSGKNVTINPINERFEVTDSGKNFEGIDLNLTAVVNQDGCTDLEFKGGILTRNYTYTCPL